MSDYSEGKTAPTGVIMQSTQRLEEMKEQSQNEIISHVKNKFYEPVPTALPNSILLIEALTTALEALETIRRLGEIYRDEFNMANIEANADEALFKIEEILNGTRNSN